MNDAKQLRLSRMKLLAFIAVFAGPLVLAMLMYFGRAWLPVPPPNQNGILIHPARPLEAFSFESPDGGSVTLESLKGQWTLLYMGGACDLSCEANLYKLRQIRSALGKDANRVRRVYLLTEREALPALEPLLQEHPDLRLGVTNPAEVQNALQLEPEELTSPIFILDPLGNLILRYQPDIGSKALLKDLKRLLRISQIG